MGGGGRTQTTTQTNTPWEPQGQQLEYMLRQARSIYDEQQANGPAYVGTRYAGMDPVMAQGLGIMGSTATDGMLPSGQLLTGVGNSNVAAGSGFGNTAANFSSGNFGPAGTTSPLGILAQIGMAQSMGQGLGATSSALGTINQGIQRASTDQTGAIVRSADGMINNDVLNKQIDAVNRDVGRSLSEEVLPTLNRQASLGGSLNSSRAGAAEAIAVRGAQDRAADNAAAIRADAYKNALTTASNANQFGTQALLSAGGAQAGIGQAGISAGSDLAGLTEQMRQANINGMLQGNSQAGSALQVGSGLTGQGLQTQLGAGQTLAGVGQARQEEAQNILNDQIMQKEQQPAWQWNLLQNFQRFAADPSMANFGTQTSTQKASTSANWLQTALGASSMIGGLASGGSSLLTGLGGLFGGGNGGMKVS